MTASAKVSSCQWDEALKYARLGNPMCHSSMRELHTDVRLAAAGIYAASVMLSRKMYMLYLSKELRILYGLPIEIAVDSTTAIFCSSGTVKKGKMHQ